MVTFDPVRFALIRTPSMGPSSCELTRPVSAGEEELCAPTMLEPAQKRVTASPARIPMKKRCVGIGVPPLDFSTFKPVQRRRIIDQNALPRGFVRRPFCHEIEEQCVV